MVSKLQDKIEKILVGLIFVFFASILFREGEYGWCVILLLALLLLMKLDLLEEMVFSIRGGLQAKFQVSHEKIEANIRENEEPVTHENFVSFRNVESRILGELQKRYGAGVKTLIHFMYGPPDKPEFRYTPDASLQTDDTLYFFEIKYVLKPEFLEKIIRDTSAYLKTVYDKFSSAAGKRLVMKLVLASPFNIDTSELVVPEGIEIESFRV